MIPLTLANIQEKNTIKRIGGNPETKRHLENLGFLPDTEITVVTKNNGNVIVNVKDCRVAISETLAKKIMI